ncbi:MAG: GyrI-like domain-containing protein [Brumimicrobium sp.]
MKTIDKNISTFGLLTELTNYQADNFKIIKNHWKLFNAELKKYNLTQNGGNWEKYGITYKTNGTYFYLTTIPQDKMVFPEHFVNKEIPKGKCEVFVHTGKMENIKQTIHNIYKIILPNSNLAIEHYSKTGFIHFEKYDYRFRWDKPTSEIDIYLPVNTNN